MSERAMAQKTATPSFTPVRSGILQRQCACGKHTIAGGECAECRQKRLNLQRRSTGQAEPATAPPIVHDVLRSPGQPLDATTRAFMEPRFGHDFSGVHVLTDVSHHIQPKLAVGQVDDQYEREADRVANQIVQMETPPRGSHVMFGVAEDASTATGGKRLIRKALVHTVPLESHRSVQAASSELKIQQRPAPIIVRLKPDQPSAEMQERINRVEKLIEKDYSSYIDKAKFKSPLKDKIVWYSDPKEIYVAKWAFARELSAQAVSQLKGEEKKKELEKYKGMVLENPTFDQVKEYIILSKQIDYFKELGGDEVPAFYDHLTGKIHTNSDLVGVIAHEAFHYYGSHEFRDVFGAGLDEGMTQYLAEEVEHSYLSTYGIQLSSPSPEYAENVKLIENFIKSSKLAKNEFIKSYLTGGKGLLVTIKKMMDKAKPAKKEESKEGTQSSQKGAKGPNE